MVEQRSPVLDRTFAALSDPTRRSILARLARGEACVTEVAEPHAMSLAAVSKHLTVLEKAGLVRRIRRGRSHFFSLKASPLEEAQSWIGNYRQFWERNIDQFEKYLNQVQNPEIESNDHE